MAPCATALTLADRPTEIQQCDTSTALSRCRPQPRPTLISRHLLVGALRRQRPVEPTLQQCNAAANTAGPVRTQQTQTQDVSCPCSVAAAAAHGAAGGSWAALQAPPHAHAAAGSQQHPGAVRASAGHTACMGPQQPGSTAQRSAHPAVHELAGLAGGLDLHCPRLGAVVLHALPMSGLKALRPGTEAHKGLVGWGAHPLAAGLALPAARQPPPTALLLSPLQPTQAGRGLPLPSSGKDTVGEGGGAAHKGDAHSRHHLDLLGRNVGIKRDLGTAAALLLCLRCGRLYHLRRGRGSNAEGEVGSTSTPDCPLLRWAQCKTACCTAQNPPGANALMVQAHIPWRACYTCTACSPSLQPSRHSRPPAAPPSAAAAALGTAALLRRRPRPPTAASACCRRRGPPCPGPCPCPARGLCRVGRVTWSGCMEGARGQVRKVVRGEH